jgi:DNA-binding winged helix-turn-helix (wHTH) protein
MTGHKSSVFSFGDVQVREGEFLLIMESGVVPVEPKAFRVLIYLLQNPGRVVTKEEILESVWNDCSVSDNSLTRSVATLRRLLHDDTREPRYIATVPTLGYRFLCPVEVTYEASIARQTDEPLAASNGMNQQSVSPPPESIDLAVAGNPGIAVSVRPRTGLSRRAIRLAIVAAIALVAVVIGLVVTRPRHVPANYASESRLTANPQDIPVTSSAISPDARFLAFGDRTGLYIRQLDGGETHRLSLPESLGPALVEDWFPDGAHLLISSWDGGPRDPQSLWKISLTGTAARKLVVDGEYARVSPDGSWIAFSKVADGRTEIWTIRADTGEAHEVLAGSATQEEYLSRVAWSPDSQKFGYVRTTIRQDGNVDRVIEILELASHKVKIVLSNPTVMPALAWTQENVLVYSRYDEAPNQKDLNLWEARIDSQTGKIEAETRITSGHGFIVELTAASGGNVLALRRVDPHDHVYLAELRGGRQLAPPTRLSKENWGDDAQSWTADSKAVLLTSDRDGHQHIYKQAIDQQAPDLLVGGEHEVGLPRLNPQGSEMLYLQFPVQAESSRDVQIRQTPLSGGTSRLVLHAPAIWNYQCARLPSTVCIYCSGSDKDLRFFSFDSKTGTRSELPSNKLKNTSWSNWSLSADGKYLAGFSPIPHQDAVIRIISLLDDSERRLPLPGWIGLNGMDWAADDKSFWVSACTQHSSPWGAPNTCTIINADLNGKINPLLDGRDIHFYAAIPSPSGGRLALAGGSADNSNVWVIKARH